MILSQSIQYNTFLSESRFFKGKDSFKLIGLAHSRAFFYQIYSSPACIFNKRSHGLHFDEHVEARCS